MSKTIKWVVFDLDDTLIGSRKYGKDVYDAARMHISKLIAKQIGWDAKKVFLELTKIKKRISATNCNFVPIQNSRALWIKFFMEKHRLKINAKEFEKEYFNFLLKNISLAPYTKLVLRKLRNHYKLAIFSNSDGLRKTKLDRIKKFSLQEYVDKIILTDDIGINKPQVEAYYGLLNRLKVSRSEVVYVGDSIFFDIIPAKKVGMKTILVNIFSNKTKRIKGRKYADFVVKDLREIPSLLEKLVS